MVCQPWGGQWCGLCYANVKKRSNFKGHRGYVAPRPRSFEGIEMALKRRDVKVGEAAATVVMAPDAIAKKVPLLWEFLTCSKYDDGSARVMGTLIIFCDAGCLKAFLNDRDAGLSACVTAGSFLGLLEAINDGLVADSLDWRSSDRKVNRKR